MGRAIRGRPRLGVPDPSTIVMTTLDQPPMPAILEAVRRLASRAAGREIALAEVGIRGSGWLVGIRVRGMTPDPLVYATLGTVLRIGRNIAAGWN